MYDPTIPFDYKNCCTGSSRHVGEPTCAGCHGVCAGCHGVCAGCHGVCAGCHGVCAGCYGVCVSCHGVCVLVIMVYTSCDIHHTLIPDPTKHQLIFLFFIETFHVEHFIGILLIQVVFPTFFPVTFTPNTRNSHLQLEDYLEFPPSERFHFRRLPVEIIPVDLPLWLL